MKHPFLRTAAAALALGALLLPAQAQTGWKLNAVPFYDTTHALQSLYGHWGKPRAQELATAAQALAPAVRALCEAPAGQSAAALTGARNAWQRSMMAWETLGAVAVGPVITRRTQRQMDFAPTRPALIERAIKTQPQGAKAFERIGTPAKGLPALEWLLWTQPVAPGTPACGYAVEVALDIEREAMAVASAFDTAAGTDWAAEDEQERSTAAMGEFINQWVGGIERLRWAHMEKPLRAAQGTRPPVPPRRQRPGFCRLEGRVERPAHPGRAARKRPDPHARRGPGAAGDLFARPRPEPAGRPVAGHHAARGQGPAGHRPVRRHRQGRRRAGAAGVQGTGGAQAPGRGRDRACTAGEHRLFGRGWGLR